MSTTELGIVYRGTTDFRAHHVTRLMGKLLAVKVILRLLLGWLMTGCHGGDVGVQSEPVAGDLSPNTLSPAFISLNGVTETSSRADALSSKKVFVAAKTGDLQVSTSMTYTFEPGQISEIVEIPIETDVGTVVHVVVQAPSGNVESLLSGLNLLDHEGRKLRMNTHHVLIEENTSIPSKLFTLNPSDSKPRFKTRKVRLQLPIATRKHAVAVRVDQPSTTLTLGALVQAQSYQPGDGVQVDFELSADSKSATEIKEVEAEVITDVLQVPISPRVELRGKLGGSVIVKLPAETETGPNRLRLVVRGTRAETEFSREVVVGFDVVRPHAEIVDLHQRMETRRRGPQFEVDVTVRSTTSDRFEVTGTLTGRSQAGYEVPIARATVAFDAIESGLSTGTLAFDLASVRNSPFTGPFVLRDVVLSSLFTGMMQHRIGLVEGVETTLTWGLAGNQALNDAMCDVLVESGELKAGQCQRD